MKRIILFLALILGIEVNAQIVGGSLPVNSSKSFTAASARLTGSLAIGNSTASPTRQLDVHTTSVAATGQFASDLNTSYTGLYLQGSDQTYYAALNNFGAAISFSNHLRRNSGAYLDLTSPWSSIVNPVSTGTMALGVGGMAASNEILRLTSSNAMLSKATAIGSTVVPSYTLDVTGNCRITGSINVIGNVTVSTPSTVTLTTPASSGTLALTSDDLFTTTHFHSNATTVDNVTFYFDKSLAGVSVSSGVVGRTYLPYNCTLVGYSFESYVSGTLGSAGNATISARVDNTTDITLTATHNYTALTNYNNASNLNTNINAGSYIEIKVVVPDIVTAATNVSEYVTLFYKRR